MSTQMRKLPDQVYEIGAPGTYDYTYVHPPASGSSWTTASAKEGVRASSPLMEEMDVMQASGIVQHGILLQLEVVQQKLREATEEIRQLRDELSRRPLVSTINLYDLGADSPCVKLPISVILHETEEEALARWPETRAYGIGCTLAEAISNLKQNITTLFFDLKSREPGSLGDIAMDTLKVLETHLQVSQ